MTKPMNCQTAHEQLQELLDRRWNGPMPTELHEHLGECQACQSWQSLFRLQSGSANVELSPDFAQRVVSRYTRDQRRYRWMRTSSLLALAASVVVAIFVWLTLQAHQMPVNDNSSQVAQEKSRQLYQNMKQEWSDLQACFTTTDTQYRDSSYVSRMANGRRQRSICYQYARVANHWFHIAGAIEPYASARP